MDATRRGLLAGSLAVLAAPLHAEAQAGSVVRLGYLVSHSPTAETLGAFTEGLRELGWVEGRNLALEVRSPDGDPRRLPGLAAELVRLPVAVLVASAAPASLAAKRATATLPIVSIYTLDPVSIGLAASLARPGGNVTGISTLSLEYAAKLLELVRDVVPKASRVAVLGDPGNPSHPLYWAQLEASARALGLGLIREDVGRPDQFPSAFARMRAGAAPHGLVVMHQPLTFAHRKLIGKLAVEHRLPAVFGTREGADDGGLMAFGPSMPAMFRRAAAFVDRILRGARPADLPIEQPTKFELVVNLKTARALGLTIAPSLLLRADQAIE